MPKVVQDQFERRGLFALVFLAIAVPVTAAFQLQSGLRTLEIYAFALLLGLVVDLWLYAMRLEDSERTAKRALERSIDERDTAIEAAEAAHERLGEMESANLRLEWERSQLQEKLNAPQMSLQEILHAIDGQTQILAIVLQHRELERTGDSQWPVTSIRMRDASEVMIIAHSDGHPERFAGAYVSLIDAHGIMSASGPAAPAAANQLGLVAKASWLPPDLQESLDESGTAPAAGFSLRLSGLVFAPYNTMTDSEISQLSETLQGAARRISESLVSRGQLTTQVPEEVE